ncbi:MAG: Methyltransferase type 11 [Candidatus Collierbacteria bacterium GW2011_GWB1_44_35]|uniref:Methyltransferase type 11 n=2 Tax=Candidatus Collieribacteriota TaxID=1752725 RepID=A0A0G1LFI8_9BACT|nr:MAG: Methyltransferase type 11 [Candidatus Collierbacteria bacterium GW2011_GWA1_44_12]KKT67467.1 MAG: Methyltransferase type 11 [Candidatus Collierbacteria bacterium GW2011_GWB1_44_35]
MGSELYGKEYGEIQSRDLAKEYLEVLNKKFTDVKGEKVLELGVGTGSLMPFLMEKFGEGHVFGVDINGWLLRNSGKVKESEGGIEGKIEQLPIASGSIDRVVSLHTFEHSRDLRAALNELERVLVPDGEALIIVPRPQFGIKELGALFDTLKLYPGFDNLIKAWKMAGEYHVQNVTPKKISEAETDLVIAESETMFIPSEWGSVWVVTLKKGK